MEMRISDGLTTAEKLKKARIKSKLTLEDIAEKLSTTKQTIFKYENGIITNIPSDKIELLSEILNISPGYLMGWEHPKGYDEAYQYALETNYFNTHRDFIETLDDYEFIDYICNQKKVDKTIAKCDYVTNENKTLFTTPQEAFEYIIKQPTVAMYGGYDLEKMSDEELIEFANDLADMLSIISKKYNK